MGIGLTRHPSAFVRLSRGVAQRTLAQASVPAELHDRLAATVETALWQEWREQFGDDRARIQAPAVEPRTRAMRVTRILRSIAAGESYAAIARREGVDEKAVRYHAARSRTGKQGP